MPTIAVLVNRVRDLLEGHIARRFQLKYAQFHRSRLNRVTFVGVTGSVGKTAAETIITAILTSAGSATHSRRGGNRLHHIARTITKTRSEEHTSELQSLMRISYAVFCLKK